jgi:hypothetical protein
MKFLQQLLICFMDIFTGTESAEEQIESSTDYKNSDIAIFYFLLIIVIVLIGFAVKRNVGSNFSQLSWLSLWIYKVL